jgi:hypothetical protein
MIIKSHISEHNDPMLIHEKDELLLRQKKKKRKKEKRKKEKERKMNCSFVLSRDTHDPPDVSDLISLQELVKTND